MKYLYQGTRDSLVAALTNLITQKMLDGDWGNNSEIAADVEVLLAKHEDRTSSIIDRVASSYDTKRRVKLEAEPLDTGEAVYRVPVDKHPPYKI